MLVINPSSEVTRKTTTSLEECTGGLSQNCERLHHTLLSSKVDYSMSSSLLILTLVERADALSSRVVGQGRKPGRIGYSKMGSWSGPVGVARDMLRYSTAVSSRCLTTG